MTQRSEEGTDPPLNPDLSSADQPTGFWERFRSLRWRILLWTAAVALGPLIIMAAQGYHCAREAIIETQQKHLRSVIESRKSALQSRLEERAATVAFLSESIQSRSPSILKDVTVLDAFRTQSQALLDTIEKCGTNCSSLMVFDADWRVLGGPAEGQTDPYRLPLDFKRSLDEAGKEVVSEVQVAEMHDARFYLGRRLTGQNGQKVGYLVVVLEMAAIVDRVFDDRAGLGNTGKVFLLTADGRYLTAPGQSVDLLGEKSHVPEELRSGASSPVLEYRDQESRGVLGASARIPGLDWTIVAEIDKDEAFGWLGRLRLRAAATGTLTLVLVLLVSLKSAARLSRPLSNLAAVSRRIAQGHHQERVEYLEGKEAHEVASAFNKMLDELATSHRRLVHAAALAAVGELSSSIVHEMRNPLSSLKMNVQALRRKVEGDPTYAELADIALNQATRLEKMSTDLLNYGKPLELQPAAVRFPDLVRDSLRDIAQEKESKQVSVRLEDHLSETPLTADQEQLRHAVTNLVLNAIQASPPGGEVIVSAEEKTEEPGTIVISVADEGPGIPQGQEEKIFQPFFSARHGGTGLGLANVKKIVDYHGGQVSALNRPEGGAVFIIRLPRGGPPG